MICTIKQTTFAQVKPLVSQYLKTLNGVSEDFWESHILESAFYQIIADEKAVGYFAIHAQNKITQFYMQDKYLCLAQPVFKKILDDYAIKTAFVATSDPLFLPLCLDFHKSVEMQAYFFDGSIQNSVREPEFNRKCIRPVEAGELEAVKILTGDFFDSLTENDLKSGQTMLYRLVSEGETLGFGITVPNRLLTGYWSVGMITLEPYRQKGVGRSIQMHLADICRENGVIPISGCWYYNHNSKRTIESAGRYSKTRLLNVIF
ncbi:MAG: hypothetical protein P4M02_08255 [Clostridia bacterium]|nr:hypothetical protein [Clostridia bacterium]